MENGDNEDSQSRKFIWVEGGGRRERGEGGSLGRGSPPFARAGIAEICRRCCYYKHLKTVEPLSGSNPDGGTPV